MNFDLADMRAFVAVAKLGSFTAAATELNLSQPALSRRIEKLETALKTRLLKRTTRRVDITNVGREFYHRASELLHGLDESLLGISEVAKHMTGEVTLSCMPSAVRSFLPKIVREYHHLYPGVLIRIVDQGANEALCAVMRREVDFAFNHMSIPHPQMTFAPVLKEPFVLACHRQHPLAKRAKVNWADLGDFDYMGVAKSSSNRFLIDSALADLPARPHPFCETQHVSTLLSLVEAGLGIAVVPEMCMPLEPSSEVVGVPVAQPSISRQVGLIQNVGHRLPPAAQKLYDQILSLRESGRSAQMAI